MAKSAKPAGRNFTFPAFSVSYENWHGSCNVPGIGSEHLAPITKGNATMFIRFELAQRAAFSVVAALAFAAVAVSAAVPVVPIA